MGRGLTSEARRRLDRLRALSIEPGRQAEYAAELLPGEANEEVLGAILRVLAAHPVPATRMALVDRYERIDTNGKRRDPGGLTRSALLRALRDIATSDERELYLRATRTYEPSHEDPGNPALVRAAGLINLSNADREAAVYRAIELLGDRECIDIRSEEPDITAVRVLGEAEEHTSLVMYLLRAAPRGELAGEALRGLAGAPEAALGHVIGAYTSRGRDEMALLGVCDILVGNRAPSLAAPFEAMLATASPDVVRYLVTSVVARRRADLLPAVLRAVAGAATQRRLAVLVESLELAHEPEAQEALATARKRLALMAPDREEPAEAQDDEWDDDDLEDQRG